MPVTNSRSALFTASSLFHFWTTSVSMRKNLSWGNHQCHICVDNKTQVKRWSSPKSSLLNSLLDLSEAFRPVFFNLCDHTSLHRSGWYILIWWYVISRVCATWAKGVKGEHKSAQGARVIVRGMLLNIFTWLKMSQTKAQDRLCRRLVQPVQLDAVIKECEECVQRLLGASMNLKTYHY